MNKLIVAASLALGLATASASAQHPQAGEDAKPSAFTALEHRQALGLTAEQAARIEAARGALREAHRVHCAPMHASKPTAAEEERHHAEMKGINDRHEAEAAAALTPTQLAGLARIHAARPRTEAGHAGGHHGSGQKTEGHAGHHPAR
ncbi:MAG TPA: hypothetical protein VF263_12390 [Longimicrobiaceae bacterium]